MTNVRNKFTLIRKTDTTLADLFLDGHLDHDTTKLPSREQVDQLLRSRFWFVDDPQMLAILKDADAAGGLPLAAVARDNECNKLSVFMHNHDKCALLDRIDFSLALGHLQDHLFKGEWLFLLWHEPLAKLANGGRHE